MLGKDIQLTADANAGYSSKDALDLCSKIDSAVLDYMEQPVNGYDVETMKKCNSLMDIPLRVQMKEYTHNQILFFIKKWMQLMERV